MKELDQYEDIKARVRSADVVIFNVHGNETCNLVTLVMS